MSLVQLNLETIKQFDEGRVWVAFGQDLKRAVLDCIDRPTDKRVRTVTVEVELVPIANDGGGGCMIANDADVKMKCKLKLPHRQTISRPMRMNRSGQLIFSDLTPENPDQTHIDEVEPGTGRVVRDNKSAAAGD